MHVICVFIDIMQDYTEEFRDITKGAKSKESLPAGSITLINQRPVGEDSHVIFFFVYYIFVYNQLDVLYFTLSSFVYNFIVALHFFLFI